MHNQTIYLIFRAPASRQIFLAFNPTTPSSHPHSTKIPGRVLFLQTSNEKKKEKKNSISCVALLKVREYSTKNNEQKCRLVFRVPCNSTDEGPGPKRLERDSNHKTALLFIIFPVSRNLNVRTCVKFTFANKIKAMYERSLVSVKVEPRSTSRLSSALFILPLFS